MSESGSESESPVIPALDSQADSSEVEPGLVA